VVSLKLSKLRHRRRTHCYLKPTHYLSGLRQSMNHEPHVEPTGNEDF
jgi:hypothetical protein